MASTALSTLVPQVRVRKCPENLILQSLRSACVEFLHETEVWREDYGNIASVADKSDYPLIPAYADSAFKRIAYLSRDGVEYHEDLWRFGPRFAENLFTYSNTFSNADWDKDDCSVSENTVTVTEPDVGISSLGQTVTVSSSTKYTFSFYVKRGTLAASNYFVYDATNGADIVSKTSYYSMTNTGYYVRVSVGFTTPATCTSIIAYPLYSPSTTGTIYIKNAQLNQGGLIPHFETTSAAESGEDTYFLTLDPAPSVSGYALLPKVVYIYLESTTAVPSWIVLKYGRYIARKAEADLKSDPQSAEHPVPWFDPNGARKAEDDYLEGVYRAKEDIFTEYKTGYVGAELPPFLL